MAKLNLIETIQTKLSTLAKKDGQLIVTRDNASLYIDLNGSRIYISDWIDILTDTERLAMLSPLNNKYYYVVETNKIWRYISGSWVLVTKDNFVDSSRKIAGIDLNDDITSDELIDVLGIDNKVDKVDGMGLSTNNYSNEEKATVAQNKADIVELLNAQDITNTTSDTMANSYDGYVRINKILGNTTQDTTTGKNLFSGTPTEPNVYYSLENEKTELDSWDTYIASVTGGESYTVSGIDTTTGGTGFLAFENDTFLESVSSYKNGTFTVPINCNKLKYSVRKSGKDAFMLEKGTTTTEYEPFTNGASPNPDYPQEIESVVLSKIRTCGKNLAKIDETDFTVSDNYITNKGVNGSYLMKSLSLKANTTYYINLLLLSKPTVSTSVVAHINNSNTIDTSQFSFVNINAFNLNAVVTKEYTPKQDETLYYRMWGNTNSETFNFQFWISTDEADNTYEPYTESIATLPEPITLNGIGGVQDYVDAKRGVLVQKFTEIVLNGSENWTLMTGDGWYQFYKMIPSATSSENAMCTNFQQIAIADRGTKKGLVKYTDNTFRFALLPEDGITTADEWKTWLTSNPITVLYELATPIETPLPDADVEALKSLKTYDGATHILTDSEVAPYLDMDYGTSKVGAVALQACVEGCIALSRTNDNVEMTDSDIESIYNEVFNS